MSCCVKVVSGLHILRTLQWVRKRRTTQTNKKKRKKFPEYMVAVELASTIAIAIINTFHQQYWVVFVQLNSHFSFHHNPLILLMARIYAQLFHRLHSLPRLVNVENEHQ